MNHISRRTKKKEFLCSEKIREKVRMWAWMNMKSLNTVVMDKFFRRTIWSICKYTYIYNVTAFQLNNSE